MSDLRRLEELFQEAADLPAGERSAFLEARAIEPTLRARLAAMLADLDRGDTLERPTPGSAGTADPALEATGSTLGRYRLLEILGEGGFGVVYRAEQQEPVRRQVALKLIQSGMETREVVARFEAERQALALMDHPSIAKVLDGGLAGPSD
ncbi:MAG: protein kinase, partial [Holophagales bacterium]|nr:protein kinase [Holophagales bacterium]